MGALIPLAITLAPEIGKWLFGTKGEATATAVAQVVQAVTGTSDADAAQAALVRDPQLATQLRLQLAQLAAQNEQAQRQADLDDLEARLRDVASARSQTVDLARANSPVAWGAPIVSIVVLLIFGYAFWIAFNTPPDKATPVQIGLTEILKAALISVIGYWVGSSAGSDRKTALLYHSSPAQPPASD